ncbi:DEAD/DEAH box helicase [Limnoraphis robusta Tam1]|uniref:DEAD/DEAH box helicase n=1 Tax=Limnoraphis robusta TaxID=1118279 RepID=UPI002B1F6D8B|nr:DEAD/DEAH box helicase [Limnoraphis robusta]MEA5540355.1 DEAD/DEAH box helicase [Limnoraphis robusta Tam1]
MLVLQLQEILDKGEDAIVAASTFLAQKMATLDCADVDKISTETLNLLFAKIPQNWQFVEFAEIINIDTLSAQFSQQLVQFVQQRVEQNSVSPNTQHPTSETQHPKPNTRHPTPETQHPTPDTPLHPIKILDHVIAEYRDYLLTEFRAKDPDLKQSLEDAIDRPLFLAQEPFYQVHRPFKSGERWRNLPIDLRLAEVMEKRSKSKLAYLHQSDAIAHLLGENASPLVVTTGTGSGKTETFLLPVIQNAIEDSVAFKKSGLTAILVYPMNALSNDQLLRINTYLKDSGWAGAVSVAKYDRGTTQEERYQLRENPPQILLTNYMMLEYLLVRPADRERIFANHRCRFLVLDEVHSYRGSLGSNIALLVRRLQAHLKRATQDYYLENRQGVDKFAARRYPVLIPVGTSATIKSVAEKNGNSEEETLTSLQQRDRAVQEFFAKISGAPSENIRVIGEELEEIVTPSEAVYSSQPVAIADIDIQNSEAVTRAICQLSEQPLTTPLDEAVQRTRLLWDLNRWLIRSPMSLTQIVEKVKTEVKLRQNCSPESLQKEIETALLAGAALPEGTPGALRIRAHRFIRGGWHFYRCLNPECGKLYPMGEERCRCGYSTAPLYLCRNCGAHYLRLVGKSPVDPGAEPLRPSGEPSEEHEWMLYEASRFESLIGVEEEEDSPSVEENSPPKTRKRKSSKTGKQTEQMRRRPVCSGSFDPKSLAFSFEENLYPVKITLAPARTRCLCCGGTAGSRNVVTPVALGTSAAVKVLSEGLMESLAAVRSTQPGQAGKERLLVFSDSRQDAAHQARFIHFASRYDRMRRRLIELLKEEGTLKLQRAVELLSDRALQVRDNPNLPEHNQRRISSEDRQKIQAWEEAPLLDEIAINAGYRGTLINLGLVRVAYDELEDYIQEQGASLAQSLGVELNQLYYLCTCILNEIRIRGCVSRELLRYHPDSVRIPEYLKKANWERRVRSPQGFALSATGEPVGYIDAAEIPYGIKHLNCWRKPKSGGRGPSLERILKYLVERFNGSPKVEMSHMIELLEFLRAGAYLVAADVYGYRESRQLLQVNDDEILFELLTSSQRLRCQVCGTPAGGFSVNFPCCQCHGSLVEWSDAEVNQNRTVKRIQASDIISLNAREHTAQVPNDERVIIEELFKGDLSQSTVNLLACSPTLEMGIDVGGLDAVILRNVPPRPDNYAQRGGRAGRRTRVGLVISYARSTPHDQYFYDKPAEMISGEVPAPAVALGNRDVIFRHLHAIAFGAAEPGLAGKMLDYVSPQGEIKQEDVDALIAGVRVQFEAAIALAKEAWQDGILAEAELDESQLRASLEKLPDRIQDVINRTARQVIELRQALDVYHQNLQGRGAAIHSEKLIAQILGLPGDRNQKAAEADDRSGGYPLRRFAEFGILPGYEFPTQPAALRLLEDKHEADPITTARRVGINQFRPDAQVYARTRRWKVIGLDRSSPWNPPADQPNWLYGVCRTCGLRHTADEPFCPRCGCDRPKQSLPAAEFAGFLARADESPILDEEERYAARNLIQVYPQWNGQVIGRWRVGDGWMLRLSREEEVRWLNEGFPPSEKELEAEISPLHSQAKGYLLCGSCGKLLNIPETKATRSGGRRRTRSASEGERDIYGHAQQCPQRGTPPRPIALVTAEKAEVLRLIVSVPRETSDEKLQAWGLSLGYALKAGMQHCYMLDDSEVVFEFEGSWTVEEEGRRYRVATLTFIDPSLGGSGYLRRIATEWHRVAARALEHLDHPDCQTACYRCLKTYQNQRYHDLLNWTLIAPVLEALQKNIPEEQPLKLGDLDAVKPWLDAYAEGVNSPLELKFLRLFERYGFFPQKQVPVAPNMGEQPISIADFAVSEKKLAIYIDGAAFHRGAALRRDRHIRDSLRRSSSPWQVVELKAADLKRGEELVESLKTLIQ